MSETQVGSLAVDQTLRVVATGVEVHIARYRMAAFAVVVVVTSVIRISGAGDTWVPTLFFTGVLAYAIGVRLYLARVGNPPWLAPTVLFIDLVTTVVPFQILQAIGTPAQRAANALFMVYIVAPALLLLLLINGLRNSASASLGGAVLALVVFVATVMRFAGFHPAQISVCVILMIAGVVGLAGAKQARASLESFARLDLLRRYLPPAAVERVMREHPDEALALGGRLVDVTLLAADLRGFTAMSEKLSPSEVMSQLNAYHGVMIGVIDEHGGAIDKFIGDGTLVVFGLEGDPKTAATSAVNCAKEMLAALERHNVDRVKSGAAALRMGIGVHSGPVIAGNLGVPGRRLEFTVIGDAVNTVSRLEGETKVAGCAAIVSSATADLLPDKNALRELAPVSLRGRNAAVQVYGLADA